jgi:hypothetical protein
MFTRSIPLPSASTPHSALHLLPRGELHVHQVHPFALRFQLCPPLPPLPSAFCELIAFAMQATPSVSPAPSEQPQPMTNWMGNVVLRQATVAAPSTITELQQVVRAALPPLRVMGSGHSFTPLCHCDGGGTLVSLRNLRRVWDVRPGSDGAASVVCEGGASPPTSRHAAFRTPFASGPTPSVTRCRCHVH